MIEVSINNAMADKRLDIILVNLFPNVSRSKLKKWILNKNVLVDGNNQRPSYVAKYGENLTISLPEPEKNDSWVSQNININIVYQDESILVIDKSPGIIMHPGSGNPDGTLLNALIYKYPELIYLPRAGIVHRLDKDTSGLVVIARSQKSYNKLVEQMSNRAVKRYYYAITWGQCKKNLVINKSLSRNPKNRQKFSVSSSIKAKNAITRVFPRGLGKIGIYDLSIVECRLETGRTHQIRVHLENFNFPIVGDKTYKKGCPNDKNLLKKIIDRQALHAYFLSFEHPEKKKPIYFNSQIPNDIKNLINEAKINVDL